ncbi:alpha/beta hydrolase [Devosia albogilva]|uniref:Alpha/beta hydrolase n=1 Tax=Devosia albogilva TaxID=429726 RepID=A0ABW5QJY2_9HYPH
MAGVLFIHSAGAQGPGEGSSALLAALKAELRADVPVDAPLMPEPENPEPGLWLPAIAAALARQQEPFVAVGHSLGGSSLLQHLAAVDTLPRGLRGVVLLAAPFWGMPDWDFDGFEVYALPPGARDRLTALRHVRLLIGDADDTVSVSHAERYRSVLPQATLHVLPGVDHEAAGAARAVADAVEALLQP